MGISESIMAAATRVLGGGGGKGNSTGSNKGDQSLAWDMYESVPEVGAFADYVSNAMQGARLFAGVRGPGGDVDPLPEGDRATELVTAIAGGVGGQSAMLSDFGTNLAVAGEAWLVVVPNPDSDDFTDDEWHVLSTEEVTLQRGKLKVMLPDGEVTVPEFDPDADVSPDTPIAVRVWNPSKRRQAYATSPVLRALVVLEELRLLNAAVAAAARSRLTGRGVLFVPAGTRFPVLPGNDQAADSLLDTFVEVASTAIKQPESAAGTVPIILEVPGDLIGGVRWQQFSSDFDTLAIQLREEAIRRFATGADIPAEVLLGLGSANHWSAWQLTAEALKLGIEPRLALVCEALTTEWLRPLLRAENHAMADEVVVWYDTASLRASSNKGASALEAFDRGLVSGEAARRELGFTEADAPAAASDTATNNPTSRTEGLPVATVQSPPGNGAQEAVTASVSGAMASALTEAVDGVIHTALVMAGQKIMRTPACPRPDRGSAREMVASGSVHTKHPVPDSSDVDAWKLLDGAWSRVPSIAGRYGVDGVSLTAALDEYVGVLLTTGRPHEFDNTVRLLAQRGILPSTIIKMVAP